MEEYKNLSEEEKDRIRILCQKLFHENYITEFVFAANEKLRKSNFDYNFILARFEIFSELLDAVGWHLHKDSSNGVIYITSDYSGVKPVLNKLETFYLFALRLLYDKKRSSASATGQVFVTVREMTEQLDSLNATDTQSKKERKSALSTLRNKNIIARIDGELDDLDCKIAILSSILCVISAAKVKLLKDEFNTETDENDESEADEDDKI